MSDPEVTQATRDRDEDSLSIVSSRESISSAMSDYERVEQSDLAPLGLPSPPGKGNDTSMEAMRRAQVRFLTLVRTNSAAAAFASATKKSTELTGSDSASGRNSARKMSLGGFAGAPFVTRPILRSSQSDVVLPLQVAVTPASVGDAEKAEIEACFDSSSKQRVQSYTGEYPPLSAPQ
jgi:hypothetical protein